MKQNYKSDKSSEAVETHELLIKKQLVFPTRPFVNVKLYRALE